MAERQLTLKTGQVNRLAKEVASYQKEAEAAKRRVDQMRANGEEPAKIVRSLDQVLAHIRSVRPIESFQRRW